MVQLSTIPVLYDSNRFVMLAMTEAKDRAPLAAEPKQMAGVKVKFAEPLARYTSMKIGGPADYFVEVADEAALADVLRAFERAGIEVHLLGNGSNVLISDRGVRGAVVRLTGAFKNISWRDTGAGAAISVGAAYAVTQLVREAARKGYTGLEFAEGIPGTVGGALYMNAGAYGSEFEKVVAGVEGMTRAGQALRLARAQLTFSYRDAHLPAGMVVTRVELGLRKGEARGVDSKVRELTSKRKGSQPSGFPNSGSMFRNPPGDFAGRLIEAAGLKGRRIGGCQISERHANFFVNLGGAKAAEVRELMDLARAEVCRRFGVELVAEVKFLGEWTAQ
jgi:UDP-N-acetylmuramate dehydrogenase